MKTANIYTTTITTSPKNKPIHLKKTSYYMFQYQVSENLTESHKKSKLSDQIKNVKKSMYQLNQEPSIFVNNVNKVSKQIKNKQAIIYYYDSRRNLTDKVVLEIENSENVSQIIMMSLNQLNIFFDKKSRYYLYVAKKNGEKKLDLPPLDDNQLINQVGSLNYHLATIDNKKSSYSNSTSLSGTSSPPSLSNTEYSITIDEKIYQNPCLKIPFLKYFFKKSKK